MSTTTGGGGWISALLIHPVALIYAGTVCYTVAAYYHLKLGAAWTFAKAFGIAVPLVLLEYQFSLRGNRAAHHRLGLGATQVLALTVAFYFVNLWLLSRAAPGRGARAAAGRPVCVHRGGGRVKTFTASAAQVRRR